MAFNFLQLFQKSAKQAEKSITQTNTFTNQTPDPEGQFQAILGVQKSANETLLEIFNNIGEVNGIISHLARVCSSIELKHYTVLANGNKKEVKNSEVLALLKNPNELKGGQVFLQEIYTNFFVFGNIYINAFKPIGFNTTTKLYLLPSFATFPIPLNYQDNYGTPTFGADFRNNPVSKYHYFINSMPKVVSIDEMIHVKDTNINGYDAGNYVGQSMLYSAINACETLKYLYETVNTILSKRGALGFIKKNNRANELSTTLTDKEVDSVIYQLNKRYGVTAGRQPIGVVNTDLSYQRIDAPINEFLPVELKNDIVKTLCRVLGNLPVQLFSSEAASTYNNMGEAQKQMYTGAVIPTVELFCSEINKYFKLHEINQCIEPDLTDIECLKDDEKTEYEAEKIKNENFAFLLQNGLITKEYWAQQIGLPLNMISNETNPGTNSQISPNEGQ